MVDAGTTAFAFPGMGVKPTGFETTFLDRHERAMRPYFEAASRVIGRDLAGDVARAGELDDRTSQVFTLAFSTGVVEVLREHGVVPGYCAGYSFGHYAALVAARVISFDDALSIATHAFDIMQSVVAGREVGMAAVIGLSAAEVGECVGDDVAIVNVNSDTCRIVAGTISSLRALCVRALDFGAVQAELLPVRISYHHPTLLAGASEQMREYLRRFTFTTPQCPIVSSIDASLMSDVDGLMEYTARHLTSPISWLAAVGQLHARGVTRMIECGPGITLTRHGQFMPYDVEYVNVKNIRRRLGL